MRFAEIRQGTSTSLRRAIQDQVRGRRVPGDPLELILYTLDTLMSSPYFRMQFFEYNFSSAGLIEDTPTFQMQFSKGNVRLPYLSKAAPTVRHQNNSQQTTWGTILKC